MKTWNYTRLDLYTYIETPDGKSRNLLCWIKSIVYGIYIGLGAGFIVSTLIPSIPTNVVIILLSCLVLYGKDCEYIGLFILKIWELIVAANWDKFPAMHRCEKIKIYKVQDYHYSLVSEFLYRIVTMSLLVISVVYIIMVASNAITLTNTDKVILRIVCLLIFLTLDSRSSKSIIDEILYI